MDWWNLLNLVGNLVIGVATGVVCLFIALTVHARMIFPTVNVLSFEHGKRTRLTIIWLKMVMIALGGLLAYIAVSFSFCFSAALEDGAVFAAAALVGLFLAIWHSYRLRLVDAIWTFMTYALFHFLFLAGLGPDWITR